MISNEIRNPFDQSKQSSKTINLDGNEICVISYEDLIINKKAVDRDIDRTDIKELKKRHKK